MRFIHTKCGGEIDVKKRQCMKCKKKWGFFAFRFNPTGIRPMTDRKGRPVPEESIRRLEGTNWVRKFPGVVRFARLLPKWPRWARILAVSTILVAIVTSIILLVS